MVKTDRGTIVVLGDAKASSFVNDMRGEVGLSDIRCAGGKAAQVAGKGVLHDVVSAGDRVSAGFDCGLV